MPTILVVESERLVREVTAGRLEAAGYEVIACPGPTAPEYSCIGTRGRRCPLESTADMILVDVETPGEEVADAASGIDLLSYYAATGKPVVAFRAGADAQRLFAETEVSPAAWPPDGVDLIETVRSRLRTAQRATG